MLNRPSPMRHTARALAALGLCMVFMPSAHALLEDAEARRAILELRQRFDATAQENAQMRRSLLDLQAQIETLRTDLAQLRGQNEQLAREASEIQRTQSGMDERLSRFEPGEVQVDGLRFLATPQERADFEAALEMFRSGDFPGARKAFAAFVNAYPQSGYQPSARFWLGNTQYAGRDYKEAIVNFRAVLRAGSAHERVAEASLSLANCYLELKDNKAARQALEALVRDYPVSDAAETARQRLKTLK